MSKESSKSEPKQDQKPTPVTPDTGHVADGIAEEKYFHENPLPTTKPPEKRVTVAPPEPPEKSDKKK